MLKVLLSALCLWFQPNMVMPHSHSYGPYSHSLSGENVAISAVMVVCGLGFFLNAFLQGERGKGDGTIFFNAIIGVFLVILGALAR